MSDLFNNRVFKRILKIIIVLVLFVLIGLTDGKTRNKTWVENIFSSVIVLPQKLINYVTFLTSEDETLKYDITSLKEENKELKEKIASLEKHVVDYDLILQENESYRALEKTKEVYDYNVVIADIIAKTQNNWDDIYVINKGSNSGIKKDMIVITEDGLVGYVTEVGKTSSKIISILDASSSLSALETKSRIQVIVKGDLLLKEAGELKLTNIPLKTKFISGDIIETAGIGGRYPKGLKIGKIIAFDEKENPLETEAIVETSVDFNKLERVAVIVEE